MHKTSLIWEDPLAGGVVEFALDVVERLAPQVNEAFQSVPRRGLEIGGVLLGTRYSRKHLAVDDYIPVESDHINGPSYNLSDSDRKRLETVLAANRNRVVGFYRSQTRSANLAPGVADMALLEQFDGDVLLLIRPAVAARPVASLTLRGGGHTDFPFDHTELMSGRYRISEGSATPLPASESKPRWWPWAAVLAAGLTLVGAGLTMRRGPVAPPPAAATRAVPPEEGLGMRADRSGRNLYLLWNGQSPAVREGTQGTLSIEDGNYNSKFNLDATQLAAGKITYFPSTNDVTFRMEVTGPSGRAFESLRVVGADAQAQVASPPPPSPRSEEVSPPVAASKPRRIESRAREIIPPAEPPQPRPSAFESSAAASSAPPERSETETASAEAPASPPPPSKPASAPVTVTVPKPQVQSVAAPYVSVKAEPVVSSRLDRVMRRIPLIRRLKKDSQTYVPPRPIQEIQPVLSAREKGSLQHPVPVDVKVYVTETGKVDFAELLTPAQDGNTDLATAAVYAARRWTFTPAQSGAEKVAAEVILHFKFAPPDSRDR